MAAYNSLAEYNPDYEIVKNPSVTQLYNAIKLSGRTKKKLGIGVFNAVAAPMYAELRHTTDKKDTSILTEPLVNYNIVVLDQAFKGRSYLTFTNTSVVRDGQSARCQCFRTGLGPVCQRKYVPGKRYRPLQQNVWLPAIQ